MPADVFVRPYAHAPRLPASQVPYCKASFEEDGIGVFASMDSTDRSFSTAEFEAEAAKVLEQYAAGETEVVWETCYVAHDSLANDIDDLPAIALARSATVSQG